MLIKNYIKRLLSSEKNPTTCFWYRENLCFVFLHIASLLSLIYFKEIWVIAHIYLLYASAQQLLWKFKTVHCQIILFYIVVMSLFAFTNSLKIILTFKLVNIFIDNLIYTYNVLIKPTLFLFLHFLLVHLYHHFLPISCVPVFLIHWVHLAPPVYNTHEGPPTRGQVLSQELDPWRKSALFPQAAIRYQEFLSCLRRMTFKMNPVSILSIKIAKERL